MERPEVFYTCEWATAVDRAYGASMKPLLLLAYDGEAMLGVAALATDHAEKQAFFWLETQLTIAISFALLREGRSLWKQFWEKCRSSMCQFCGWQICPPIRHLRIMKDAAGRNAIPAYFSRPAYQCAQIALGSTAEREKLKQQVVKRKAFRYSLKGLEKRGR